MIHGFKAESFEEWRAQARTMIAHDVLPTEVAWGDASQTDLFGHRSPPSPAPMLSLSVPPDFMALAKIVSCHRDLRRWNLLYQLLWRLTHREKNLLRVTTDPLMHALSTMEKAVRRDAHKMKAFVRFRLVQEDGNEHYIAWHRPDHPIVKLVAPFFARRFSVMKWTILTPDESAHWDGDNLGFGPGVDVSEAPQEDAMENLWRDYYRAIFNPARIKIKMMKSEMPVRHWATLPETKIIADMLADAPRRVTAMLAHTEGNVKTAADYLPETLDFPSLKTAASTCEGCELHGMATQTVFGEGPADARLMIVGEQPGDEEDLQARPFIGPSGKLFDQALIEAGLRREEIYITNAVKHFRFLYQDGFRNHRSPSRHHIHACKPWLDAEISTVKPAVILCLGNTAARSLIGAGFSVKQDRGRWSGENPRLCGTYHPSAILRNKGIQQEEIRGYFFQDIKSVKQFL